MSHGFDSPIMPEAEGDCEPRHNSHGVFQSRLEEWKNARPSWSVLRRAASRAIRAQGEPRPRGLFLNTVKHGHREAATPVWITLSASDGEVSLIYEDRAPPFNPFSRATREMLEALAETRREGGLGVILAHGLTATADYSYLFGRNRIRLTLA